MQLSTETIAAIREHAYEFPNEEVCGFVLGNGEIFRCKNSHQTPDKNFAIATTEFIKALAANSFAAGNPFAAIYHSHTVHSDWSPEDIKSSKQVNIPFVLCHTPTGRIRTYDPAETLPYTGREWSYAATNCYTLMQDWYRQELNVILPDFYMNYDRDWIRRDVGYQKNLPLNGFRQLEKNEAIEKHDVILMTLGLPYPNHVGIIVDVDANVMLHHLAGQPSSAIVYAPVS